MTVADFEGRSPVSGSCAVAACLAGLAVATGIEAEEHAGRAIDIAAVAVDTLFKALAEVEALVVTCWHAQDGLWEDCDECADGKNLAGHLAK